MMDKQTINYNALIEDAMRNVIKNALKKIEENKTTKKYCFVFKIDTMNKKVVLPAYIKVQYPEEITIIIQHQFENLSVKQTSFSVDLSFGGRISNVVIPFDSILSFSDQEAGLELRFNNGREFGVLEDFEEFEDDYDEDEEGDNDYQESDDEKSTGNLISFSSLKKRKM